MRTQRHTVGCVRFDKRRGTWNYLFYDRGKRRSQRIGTKKEFPTKAAAWKAVTSVESKPQPSSAPTVGGLDLRFTGKDRAASVVLHPHPETVRQGSIGCGNSAREHAHDAAYSQVMA